MDLRLLRSEFGEDAAKAERALTEGRAHPVVTRGGRVALVEDEVDDLEHRRQTGGKIGTAGNLERNARVAESPFGTDNALSDGGLRAKESTRDLVGCQTTNQTQRDCHPPPRPPTPLPTNA